jgi:hypothetical protein
MGAREARGRTATKAGTPTGTHRPQPALPVADGTGSGSPGPCSGHSGGGEARGRRKTCSFIASPNGTTSISSSSPFGSRRVARVGNGAGLPGSTTLRRASFQLGHNTSWEPDQVVPAPARAAPEDTSSPECAARLALFKLALEGQAFGGRYLRRRSLGEPSLRAAVPEKNVLYTMTRTTYYDLFSLRCVMGAMA